MRVGRLFILLTFALLAGCNTTTSSQTPVPPGPVEVSLTPGQARAFAEITAENRPHAAFAIQPGGTIWGRAWTENDAERAQANALRWCAERVSVGSANCILYAVDGRRVAPERVEPVPVRQKYEALDMASAAAFFPRNPVAFAADRAGAAAQFQRIEANSNALATMSRNTALEAALTGSSLVERSGQVFWLGSDGAQVLSKARSGVLSRTYRDWYITETGLLCLNFGTWDTGMDAGMLCLVLVSLGDGRFGSEWASGGGRKQGIVLRGDARFTQVR